MARCWRSRTLPSLSYSVITILAAVQNLNSFKYLADGGECSPRRQEKKVGEPRCADELGAWSEIKGNPDEQGSKRNRWTVEAQVDVERRLVVVVCKVTVVVGV